MATPTSRLARGWLPYAENIENSSRHLPHVEEVFFVLSFLAMSITAPGNGRPSEETIMLYPAIEQLIAQQGYVSVNGQRYGDAVDAMNAVYDKAPNELLPRRVSQSIGRQPTFLC